MKISIYSKKYSFENNLIDFFFLFVNGNTARQCRDDEYKCGNGQCIYGQQKCDGRRDCDDGSDESPEVCHPSKWHFFSFHSLFYFIHTWNNM